MAAVQILQGRKRNARVFIFLIVVKILFAVLKMLIFLLTLVLGILVTIIVAPFVFVPQLIKCSRGTL